MNLPQLSQQLKNEIDQWCVLTWNDGMRSHLGASEIGHKCLRYLSYKFRHVAHKIHEGRLYRLLNRGHAEEEKLIRLFEGIGCKVTQFDEAAIARGETDKGKLQLRISACKGHFGGSLDAEIELPERYCISEKLLCEMKTQGLGKQGAKISNFEKLVKEGVKLYKPMHWAQQCMYGYKRNLKYSIYIAVNKNDDNLHIELVELDHFFGASLERKAELIIFAQSLPEGVSLSPSYFECTYCDMLEVCHKGKPALINCRSCQMCEPVDNAEWYCHKWNAIVPKENIKDACGNWISFI